MLQNVLCQQRGRVGTGGPQVFRVLSGLISGVASGTICSGGVTSLRPFDLRTFIFEQEKSIPIYFSLTGHLKITLSTLIKSLTMIAS